MVDTAAAVTLPAVVPSRRARFRDSVARLAERSSAPEPEADLWLLVRDLPPRQRTAVVLRHLGGRTEAEIAAAMGVTRSTVSSTLTAAHARLADLLATDDHPNHEERPMDLTLALAGPCDETGCEVEHLDDGRRRGVRRKRLVWHADGKPLRNVQPRHRRLHGHR